MLGLVILIPRITFFFRGYKRFIIILRDPLHAALAEFNRKRSFKQDKEHSHTGREPRNVNM